MRIGISIAITMLALGGAANAQTTTASQPAGATRGQVSDSEFARKAAMSGMKEVRVSEHAAAQASSADVKQFATKLVQDHTAANANLSTAAGAASIELPADLDAEHRQQVQQLTTLSGADLDRTYVDKMVESHTKSVQLFEQKSRDGSGALAAFASSTLPTLREHLQMAQDLQRRVGASSGAGMAGTTAPTSDPAAGTTGSMGTMTTDRPATTGTTATTDRMATSDTTATTDTTRETTGTPAGASDPEMPASASGYPLAILLGIGLAALGLALRLKK